MYRFGQNLSENTLEYIHIIYYVTSKLLFLQYFGEIGRRFFQQLRALHHTNICLENYVFSWIWLEKVVDGLEVGRFCALLFMHTRLRFDCIACIESGSGGLLHERWNSRRALMYIIRITCHSKCRRKSGNWNRIRRIECVLFYLYLLELDPFSEAQSDFVIIMKWHIREV